MEGYTTCYRSTCQLCLFLTLMSVNVGHLIVQIDVTWFKHTPFWFGVRCTTNVAQKRTLNTLRGVDQMFLEASGRNCQVSHKLRAYRKQQNGPVGKRPLIMLRMWSKNLAYNSLADVWAHSLFFPPILQYEEEQETDPDMTTQTSDLESHALTLHHRVKSWCH